MCIQIHVLTTLFYFPPVEERLKPTPQSPFSQPIPRSSFAQHVKEMHRERDKNFELEYQVICIYVYSVYSQYIHSVYHLIHCVNTYLPVYLPSIF